MISLRDRVENLDMRRRDFRFSTQCFLNTKYWAIIMYRHPTSESIPYPHQFI